VGRVSGSVMAPLSFFPFFFVLRFFPFFFSCRARNRSCRSLRYQCGPLLSFSSSPPSNIAENKAPNGRQDNRCDVLLFSLFRLLFPPPPSSSAHQVTRPQIYPVDRARRRHGPEDPLFAFLLPFFLPIFSPPPLFTVRHR